MALCTVQKQRRVFNRKLLDDTIKKDGANNVKIPKNINSKANLEFTCKCGHNAKKRLDLCVDSGMSCLACSMKSADAKRALSKVAKKSLPEVSAYILMVNGQDELEVRQDETLEMCLAPAFRKPYIGNHKKYGLQVHWWDPIECIHRKKTVSTMEAASTFVKNIKMIPDEYRVSATIKEIGMRLAHYTFVYRISPTIAVHEEKPVPLNPYIFGSWLGDGSADQPRIHNIDEGVLNEWRLWASAHRLVLKNDVNMTWRVTNGTRAGRPSNELVNNLRELGVYNSDKFIPDVYKHNSVEVRMQVVAGLLDTDGCLDRSGKSYDFTQSRAHERLYDDFREVVQSLGFRMSKTYCIKTCPYKGEIKKCPAIRGRIVGDHRLADLPLRIEYKRITEKKQARHDLSHFTLKVRPS